MTKPRRPSPPSKEAIKAAWSFYLIDLGKFDSLTELWEPQVDPDGSGRDFCWGCGMLERVERAHIDAHMEGGSNEVWNYNLLCPECHRTSEMVQGARYMEWLTARNFADRMHEIPGRFAEMGYGGWTAAKLGWYDPAERSA